VGVPADGVLAGAGGKKRINRLTECSISYYNLFERR
jgi:hypothetical protein